MNSPGPFQPLFAAFRGGQFKPTVILLCSPLLLVSWSYFGSPRFFHEWVSPRLGWWDDPRAAAAMYSFTSCFLLLGVVPALIVKLLFGERLADYGVQLGDRVRTLRSFLILGPLFLLGAYAASCGPTIRDHYPVNPLAGTSPATFGLHAASYLTFYMGWEFYFRGFMQSGLRGTLGPANALLVQVLASSLLHIGKSTTEIYAAILGGILWGVLAYRTRSLLSGLAQHALLGIALDWFICYGPQ